MSDNNTHEVELTEEIAEDDAEEIVEEVPLVPLVQEDVVEEPPKPKRGRPTCSRNKPKVQVVNLEDEEENPSS